MRLLGQFQGDIELGDRITVGEIYVSLKETSYKKVSVYLQCYLKRLIGLHFH